MVFFVILAYIVLACIAVNAMKNKRIEKQQKLAEEENVIKEQERLQQQKHEDAEIRASVQKIKKQIKVHLDQYNLLLQEYRNDYVACIKNLIQTHYKVLSAKYMQLVYTDDYGCHIDDAFIREMEYFVTNIVEDGLKPVISNYEKGVNALREKIDSLENKATKICGGRINYEKYGFNYRVNGKVFYSFYIFELGKNLFYVVFDYDNNEHITTEIKECDEEYGEVNNLTVCVEYLNYLMGLDDSINKARKTKGTGGLNPIEYERHICAKLKQLGFNARTTKASGDQGVDVLAEKCGVSFAIQCKMYSKPVGNKAVQEANTGRDFYKKDYAVVICSAGFTKSARQAANACGVILLTEKQLDNLLDYVK